MSLHSKLFKGDAKLEACAISDPAHVRQGAVGEYVHKIQTALVAVDNATIQSGEMAAKSYLITHFSQLSSSCTK